MRNSLSAAFAVLASALLIACGPTRAKDEPKAAALQHDRQVEECRAEISKDPLLPISGGGYIDSRRLEPNNIFISVEHGKCGVDSFTAKFYWDGEVIVPAERVIRSFHGKAIPKSWIFLRVGAKLGDQRVAAYCRDQSKAPTCRPGSQAADPATLKVVVSKIYPGLDILLPTESRALLADNVELGLRNWKRKDGHLRVVDCFALGKAYQIGQMSTPAIEELNFGEKTFPCQMEYSDFSDELWAARVHFTTKDLRKIYPALLALQKYITESLKESDK